MKTHAPIRLLAVVSTLIAVTLVRVSPALAAAPNNDDFNSALVIGTFPFSSQIDTTQATTAVDDPYCAGNGATVWYAYTAPVASPISLKADTFGSSYDTTLSVWTGTQGNLTQVACNDDAGGTVQSALSFQPSVGQTYYFMVAAFASGAGGNLTFTVTQPNPPPNDDLSTPTTISGVPSTTTQDTSDATTAPDDPSCGGNSNSVWFSFTPTQSQRVEINTGGSSYYTTESVYTGSRGSLTQVTCDTYLSRIRFQASAGQTYYIMITSGYCCSSGGNLVLNVLQAPPAFSIQFTVNRVGLVSARTGAATIRGTITCNQSTFVGLYGYFQQKVAGRYTISTYPSAGIECFPGASPTAWSTTVSSSNGPFRAGPVMASIQAYGFNPETYSNINFPPFTVNRLIAAPS